MKIQLTCIALFGAMCAHAQNADLFSTGKPLPGSNVDASGKTHVDGKYILEDTLQLNKTLKVAESAFIKRFLKVGNNSIWIGSANPGGTSNDIYSTGGALRINGLATPNQNTEINPVDGAVVIGTNASDPAYGISTGASLKFPLVVKSGIMVTGKNSGLFFRNVPAGGGANPNSNGDIAIEFEERPTGDAAFSCTNPIRGLNIYRPFPNDVGAANYVFFVSTHANNAGNIGIGTPYPVYKLTVNGTMGAREVVVETTNWCDYVFDKSYDLMPISELKSYIEQNKHLPNIPTASHMESNGIPLSEMTRKHMEKIEELTLYIIQQQGQIDALSRKVSELAAEKSGK
jgi:hypothetical protein